MLLNVHLWSKSKVILPRCQLLMTELEQYKFQRFIIKHFMVAQWQWLRYFCKSADIAEAHETNCDTSMCTPKKNEQTKKKVL